MVFTPAFERPCSESLPTGPLRIRGTVIELFFSQLVVP
jgi:hypothetical protein